jgi:hypothetical protein
MADNVADKPDNENVDDPHALRDLLFESILREDEKTFIALCNQRSHEIVRQFAEWRQVPEGVRDNPKQANAWIHCLMTIAQTFDSAGIPQLLESLVGPPGDNPIENWMKAVGKANHLGDIGRYQESNAILLDLLDEIHGAVGSAIDSIRPKTLGLLGMNYFRLQDISSAQQYTEMALAQCDAVGDRDGILVYTENLATMLTPDSNSIAGSCRTAIAKAQDLADQHQFQRSNALLIDALDDIVANHELARYQAKVCGLLGSNHYRLDAFELAERYTVEAIQRCQKDDDVPGARIYTENLRVIKAAAGL